MNPNCPICRGIGWVCENHPEKPWDLELGCVCGAGAPCNDVPDRHQEDIKEAAMADGRPAWEIMEEAALQWLERRKRGTGD
jgi:hypothetical protein